MKENDYWNGKRVVITGGTSGLGKELAIELEKLGKVGESRSINTISADVSDKKQTHKISGESLGILDGIDVLINNASYLGHTPLRNLMDTECEDFEQVLATNLLGPFRLSKAFLPTMLLQGSGSIINISSDAAINAYPQWGGYGTSKAALDHLSSIWNEELASKNVRLLSIDPGDMDTPMHHAAIPGRPHEQIKVTF